MAEPTAATTEEVTSPSVATIATDAREDDSICSNAATSSTCADGTAAQLALLRASLDASSAVAALSSLLLSHAQHLLSADDVWSLLSRFVNDVSVYAAVCKLFKSAIDAPANGEKSPFHRWDMVCWLATIVVRRPNDPLADVCIQQLSELRYTIDFASTLLDVGLPQLVCHRLTVPRTPAECVSCIAHVNVLAVTGLGEHEAMKLTATGIFACLIRMSNDVWSINSEASNAFLVALWELLSDRAEGSPESEQESLVLADVLSAAVQAMRRCFPATGPHHASIARAVKNVIFEAVCSRPAPAVEPSHVLLLQEAVICAASEAAPISLLPLTPQVRAGADLLSALSCMCKIATDIEWTKHAEFMAVLRIVGRSIPQVTGVGAITFNDDVLDIMCVALCPHWASQDDPSTFNGAACSDAASDPLTIKCIVDVLNTQNEYLARLAVSLVYTLVRWNVLQPDSAGRADVLRSSGLLPAMTRYVKHSLTHSDSYDCMAKACTVLALASEDADLEPVWDDIFTDLVDTIMYIMDAVNEAHTLFMQQEVKTICEALTHLYAVAPARVDAVAGAARLCSALQLALLHKSCDESNAVMISRVVEGVVACDALNAHHFLTSNLLRHIQRRLMPSNEPASIIALMDLHTRLLVALDISPPVDASVTHTFLAKWSDTCFRLTVHALADTRSDADADAAASRAQLHTAAVVATLMTAIALTMDSAAAPPAHTAAVEQQLRAAVRTTFTEASGLQHLGHAAAFAATLLGIIGRPALLSAMQPRHSLPFIVALVSSPPEARARHQLDPLLPAVMHTASFAVMQRLDARAATAFIRKGALDLLRGVVTRHGGSPAGSADDICRACKAISKLENLHNASTRMHPTLDIGFVDVLMRIIRPLTTHAGLASSGWRWHATQVREVLTNVWQLLCDATQYALAPGGVGATTFRADVLQLGILPLATASFLFISNDAHSTVMNLLPIARCLTHLAPDEVVDTPSGRVTVKDAAVKAGVIPAMIACFRLFSDATMDCIDAFDVFCSTFCPLVLATGGVAAMRESKAITAFALALKNPCIIAGATREAGMRAVLNGCTVLSLLRPVHRSAAGSVGPSAPLTEATEVRLVEILDALASHLTTNVPELRDPKLATPLPRRCMGALTAARSSFKLQSEGTVPSVMDPKAWRLH